MRLYLVTAGEGRRFVRTTERDARNEARESGGSFEAIDAPTVGRDLIAQFLNELLAAPAPAAATTQPQPRDAVDPSRCPKCHMTARGAELHARGMEASAIARKILEAEGFALGILAGAVAERFEQLQGRAH